MSKQTEAQDALISPQLAMLQMISSFWISRGIWLVAKLGIPDLVKDQPKTPAELADATGTHAPSLYRVLRALAAVGVFAEDEQGRFASTPLAATLRRDVPGSLRAFAIVELGEEHYPSWGELMHCVKTGETGMSKHFGMTVWEFFATHPENAVTFNESMLNMAGEVDHAIMAAYDFSGFTKVVDVGGGIGGMAASILQVNPSANGVVFDLPHVIDQAKPFMEGLGLAKRCELVAGDFFESVPAGGSAYLLRHILHDWDDERCVAILTSCRRAMVGDARLLVFDAVIPSGNELSYGKFMDLNMLVMAGGRERTESEFRSLFEASGFRLSRVIPTHTDIISIVEGVPV